MDLSLDLCLPDRDRHGPTAVLESTQLHFGTCNLLHVSGFSRKRLVENWPFRR